jgi:hypothetical protein
VIQFPQVSDVRVRGLRGRSARRARRRLHGGGPRPRSGPVWIGGAAALLGIVVTLLFVRDTGDHVELEHAMADQACEGGPDGLPTTFRARLWHASWAHRPLFAAD